jgi:hypothetical protein
LVVLLQQFLVGEIDAQLLERVVLEILKTKNIQQIYRIWFFIGRIQGDLNLVNDKLKDGVVNGLC